MAISGVYIITCITNGKHYIGSSSRDITDRISLHKSMLLYNRHHSILLQRAYNKYGIYSFTYKILEYCNSDQCVLREQYWLDLTLSYKPEYGFNICEKAYSTLGCKFENRKPKGPEHLYAGINKSIGTRGIPKSREHAMAVGKARKIVIIQNTLDGSFIKEWPSARDVELELGYKRSNINHALNGHRPSAYGYKWAYK